mmetsp:Transcript_34891/g.81589  ORF Transcript_34891/g.81589 Transcript_34891/m.81589 type:complete len:208 (-) Transcript_34891:3-626(-)
MAVIRDGRNNHCKEQLQAHVGRKQDAAKKGLVDGHADSEQQCCIPYGFCELSVVVILHELLGRQTAAGRWFPWKPKGLCPLSCQSLLQLLALTRAIHWWKHLLELRRVGGTIVNGQLVARRQLREEHPQFGNFRSQRGNFRLSLLLLKLDEGFEVVELLRQHHVSSTRGRLRRLSPRPFDTRRHRRRLVSKATFRLSNFGFEPIVLA